MPLPDDYRSVNVSDIVKIRRSPESGFDPEPSTLPMAFLNARKNWGDDPAIVSKEKVQYTFHQYFENSMKFAKACKKIGVQMFSRCALLGFNSPEYFFTMHGCWMLGAITVGIYNTNAPEACEYILNGCEAEIILCEGGVQAEKIFGIRKLLPHLKTMVVYWPENGCPATNDPDIEVYKWSDFLSLGNDINDSDMIEDIRKVQPGQCATLVYTSGTTGNPKGVMISHDACVFNCNGIHDHIAMKTQDRYTSFLPLSHIAAQYVDVMVPIISNVCVYICFPDALRGSLKNTLVEAQPTLTVAVPRVYEKMLDKINENINQSRGIKKAMANWAMGVGTKSCLSRQFGQPYKKPFGYGLAERILFKKVRQSMGFGECRCLVVSAAPVREETLLGFARFDLPIFDLFGQSEGCAPITSNTYCNNGWKIKSSGKPMPGVQVKIGAHDEILYKGRNVMMGYLHLPDDTEESLDSDGWFHSGDQGRIDEDGFLFITGRIKELIVTSGGENVPPALIEEQVMSVCPEISNIVIVGDKQKYLSCLVCLRTVMDPVTNEPTNQLHPMCLSRGVAIGSTAQTVEEAINCPKWKEFIQSVLEKHNESKSVSNAHKIQKFSILPKDLSLENGELTATMKLKRNVVHKHYQKQITEMYSAGE